MVENDFVKKAVAAKEVYEELRTTCFCCIVGVVMGFVSFLAPIGWKIPLTIAGCATLAWIFKLSVDRLKILAAKYDL